MKNKKREEGEENHMKPREQVLARLLFIGGEMSNACFNLEQMATLTPRNRQVLRQLQQEWDKTLAEFKHNRAPRHRSQKAITG